MSVLKVDPSWRKQPCPFCGKQLYCDDKNLNILHEAPECQRFSDLCKRFEGHATKLVYLEESPQ